MSKWEFGWIYCSKDNGLDTFFTVVIKSHSTLDQEYTLLCETILYETYVSGLPDGQEVPNVSLTF